MAVNTRSSCIRSIRRLVVREARMKKKSSKRRLLTVWGESQSGRPRRLDAKGEEATHPLHHALGSTNHRRGERVVHLRAQVRRVVEHKGGGAARLRVGRISVHQRPTRSFVHSFIRNIHSFQSRAQMEGFVSFDGDQVKRVSTSYHVTKEL